jgi:predicted RNase H-like HicB family nuclease
MRERTTAIRLSAVVFQEDGWWSAQCLEYDIAAQAKTLPDLHDELERVLAVHVAACLQIGREPFDGLEPAPRKFWDMYESADLKVEGKRLPMRLPKPAAIPHPELRVARLAAA